MTAIFKAKAPGIMALLMIDFAFSLEDAAAVVGNAGHESGGFEHFQELKPTVPGSAGGFGWMQWTGMTARNPRRRDFEAYCKRNRLPVTSDKANYGWLFVELKGSEKKAVNLTKQAVGLDAKVVAFEKAFLRAGVKHYPSRQRWARMALEAWEAAGRPRAAYIDPHLRIQLGEIKAPVPVPTPRPEPVPTPTPVTEAPVPSTTFIGRNSKAIGAFIGSTLALAVIQFPALAPFLTEEVQLHLVALGSIAGTWLASKNQE